MSAVEGGALVRGLADGDAVRVIGVDARLAAEEARKAHNLSPEAAALCAQGIVAAGLLAAYVKGEERLTVQIQAEQPPMSFFAEIDAEGHVRARISPTTARPGPGGKLSGVLLAIKADAKREMYRGLTEIRDQTLEQALEEHLRVSSQLDAVLRLETQATEAGVEVASGVLLERLPEASDKPSMGREAFQARYRSLPEGSAADVVEGLRHCKLLDGSFSPLEDRAVLWQCRCSQEKVEGMLFGLETRELQAMAHEDHGAEVVCHFCNTVYKVSEARLREILATRAD